MEYRAVYSQRTALDEEAGTKADESSASAAANAATSMEASEQPASDAEVRSKWIFHVPSCVKHSSDSGRCLSHLKHALTSISSFTLL